MLITCLLMLTIVALADAGTTSKPYNLVIAPGTPSYEAAAGQVASGEEVRRGYNASYGAVGNTDAAAQANLIKRKADRRRATASADHPCGRSQLESIIGTVSQ